MSALTELNLWNEGSKAKPQERASSSAQGDRAVEEPASAYLAWREDASGLAEEAAAQQGQGIAADLSQTPTSSQPRTLEVDPRYRTMLARMQFGQWPEVAETLTALKTEYPQEPILDALLNEATLKAELVINWGTKIQGRRLSVGQERVLRRGLPFMLLLCLMVVCWTFYESFVAPSRRVVAMASAIQTKVAEAQTLVQNGQYEEALHVYEQILARDASNAAAVQGLAETREMMGMVAQYDLAMQLAQEGKSDRALAFLLAIQENSPGFRDVEAKIKQLQAQGEVQLTFEAAEQAYAQQRWLDAVALYEKVAEAARDFQTETVSQHLSEAYYRAGMQLVGSLPAPEAGPDQAYDYLRKGKAVDTAAAEIELERLESYFDGKDALDAGDLDEAINLWHALYDVRPDYLGGYLAGRLYAAYLSLGAQAEGEANPAYAASLYEQAVLLKVDDISGAQTRLAALQTAIAPTATPQPEQAAAVYAPPPPPTATPTPDFHGLIAFRTNRNGAEEIYLMRPDGSEQQPAPAGFAAQYADLFQAESRSPDGSKLLHVQAADGRADANIYMSDLNIPEGQPRDTMLTDLRGDEYDPVWSPGGDRIAFVANQTGNDEVWVMGAGGENASQLTWNEWEWDKRPSWSPDGSQIVFYSNRTGWRQIWVMDSSGGTQLNLSMNAYEDWDPVWIK